MSYKGMMNSHHMAKRCQESIYDGHKHGYPHVGEVIHLPGGKTCRVRRGVRLAMVWIGANTCAGGFVANTTLGERVALVRDKRFNRRVWRAVSKENEWTT